MNGSFGKMPNEPSYLRTLVTFILMVFCGIVKFNPLIQHHDTYCSRAEAFLIAVYGHTSFGDSQGRLRESDRRDPLSAITTRLPRRSRCEESEVAPATPLVTTGSPEVPGRRHEPGPRGTPHDPITIDIDLAQLRHAPLRGMDGAARQSCN